MEAVRAGHHGDEEGEPEVHGKLHVADGGAEEVEACRGGQLTPIPCSIPRQSSHLIPLGMVEISLYGMFLDGIGSGGNVWKLRTPSERP